MMISSGIRLPAVNISRLMASGSKVKFNIAFKCTYVLLLLYNNNSNHIITEKARF